MEIRITKTEGNWTMGTIDGFDFEVKHYQEGSEFGINGGRISKLWIGNKGQKAAAWYERGWGKKPHTTKERKAMNAIIERFN